MNRERIYKAACTDLARIFLKDVNDSDDMDVTELAEAIEELCKEFCKAISEGE